MDTLEAEKVARVTVLKTKLSSLSPRIKAIVDQGRLVSTDPSQLFLFKGMFTQLKSHYDTYNQIWDSLVEFFIIEGISNVFPSQQEKGVFQAVERYYYEASAIYAEHMNPTPVSCPNASVMQSSVLNESRIVRARLPQINLPEFTGNPLDWPLFRDTYRSLIHDDHSLSQIEKFHFLISSLRGPALALIKGVPLQEENYEQAWQLLIAQYNDKRMLAISYLKAVLEFKPHNGKPTLSSLKSFLTSLAENISAFKLLKIPEADDFILFFLANRCLDSFTRREFEREYATAEFPKYKNLVDFVKREWRTLDLTTEESPEQSLSSRKVPQWNPNRSYISNRDKSKTSLFVGAKKSMVANYGQAPERSNFHEGKCDFLCPVCKSRHTLYQCSRFRSAPPKEKLSLLTHWNGCRNCLSGKHSTSDCSSPRSCQQCQRRHHSWLHIVPQRNPHQVAIPSSPVETKAAQDSHGGVSLGGTCQQGEVILGTALAELRDATGHYQTIRLVMDCGSQYSFITEKCVRRLGFRPKPFHRPISGIGQVVLKGTHGQLSCSIRSFYDGGAEFRTEAIVVSEITTELPHTFVPADLREQYSAYRLADPTFWRPGPVDFLLGADLYFEVLTGAPITLSPHIPKLTPTQLGYIVAGKGKKLKGSNWSSALFAHSSENLTEMMTTFWMIEEIPPKPILSEEEVRCENHFAATHYRLDSGRYVLALPFKQSASSLSASKGQATSRLLNLEIKLGKHPLLRAEYHTFLKEYLLLDHMKLAQLPAAHVIPHHCVVKQQDENFKLRVVFDASCRTQGSGSLNDHLMVGPKLQLDIGEIILNFRTHLVVMTADIVKMYRQILIRPEDRRFQHILWRFDPAEKITEYELNTVTYGLSASPFLALRTIKQLVMDEGQAYPRASKALLHAVYVDDIVTGAATVQEALSLQSELIALLEKGGFELSKWTSNRQELLDKVSEAQQESSFTLAHDEDLSIKILGLQWIPKNDVFTYKICKLSSESSKRGILSLIARIYDPLGYLSPIVFFAKIILQDTWLANCGWDEPVPSDIQKRWTSFTAQLDQLSAVKIPRCISSNDSVSHQLIGFSDASQRGYAAAIYLKVWTRSESRIHLVKAKTKLAPTKLISIPRLELCGALLLSRLYSSCKSLVETLNITDECYFTDSSVVLGWLSTPPHQLKTFVAHRVVEILEVTEMSQWRHVRSEDNPVDCASRGLLPSEVVDHPLWWSGPEWLSFPTSEWPVSSVNIQEHLPELKPSQPTTLVATQPSDLILWIERFSSYSKLIRVLAYILRFVNKLKSKTVPKGPIQVNETKSANLLCIKLVQGHHYLVDGKLSATNLANSKALRSLDPFIDEVGVVRVGGRLRHSPLPYQARHPILLPGKCHFSSILVDHYHRAYLHLGPTALQAMLQSRYWICSARNLIRQRVHQCVTCFRSRQQPQAPFMGNLPSSRFAEGKAFHHVGVDFGGPFYIRESLRRKAALGKAYLCLFVCMSTKALHLEVVSKCSTEAFLAAFDRFISRRGKPAHMYSDCGSNFVGASNKLKELQMWQSLPNSQDDIVHHAASQDIEWSFNPPYAPHFGGIWEAGIKSAKSILQKVVGDLPLTFEELTTMFCRIEAILNSRPLCPVSSDPENFECLTPGHFLLGGPITSAPEEILLDQRENPLKRWQLVQRRVQHFWSKWRLEYLHQLQQRSKWLKPQKNLSVGDLVIMKDPSTPPTKWALARVHEAYPGDDGIVRVVTLRTPSGLYKRPLVRLIPLYPVNNLEVSNSDKF